MSKRRAAGEPIDAGFTIVRDTREQYPFPFEGLVDDKGRPLRVRVWSCALATGDYSIVGMEEIICVERKSPEDLFSTLSAGRERFEAEHQRMTLMQRAAVVIEADWATMLRHPPKDSQLSPLGVYRTSISWYLQYSVPWFACPGRRFAEITTFQILKKYWELSQEEKTLAEKKEVLPPDVVEALKIVDDIESLADEVPDEGQDFAQDVLEKTRSIATTIERSKTVTTPQLHALQNMQSGLARWIRD